MYVQILIAFDILMCRLRVLRFVLYYFGRRCIRLTLAFHGLFCLGLWTWAFSPFHNVFSHVQICHFWPKKKMSFFDTKKNICVILLTKKKRYVIFLTKRKICVIFNSFFSKLFCLLNYFNVYIRKNMYFNLFGSIDKWLVKSPLARGLIKKIWNAHYKF